MFGSRGQKKRNKEKNKKKDRMKNVGKANLKKD